MHGLVLVDPDLDRAQDGRINLEPPEGYFRPRAHPPRVGLLPESANQAGLGVGVQHARKEVAERLILCERADLHALGRRGVDGFHDGDRGHLFASDEDEGEGDRQRRKPYRSGELPCN